MHSLFVFARMRKVNDKLTYRPLCSLLALSLAFSISILGLRSCEVPTMTLKNQSDIVTKWVIKIFTIQWFVVGIKYQCIIHWSIVAFEVLSCDTDDVTPQPKCELNYAINILSVNWTENCLQQDTGPLPKQVLKCKRIFKLVNAIIEFEILQYLDVD